MKARLEAGKVVKYSQIPNQVDNILGGARNLNPEDLGFYDVIVPDYDPVTQSISNLHMDAAYPAPTPDNASATRTVFTYDVSNKTISETVDELKQARITALNKLVYDKLQPTDFYVTRFTEKAVSIPSAIQVARDAIRTAAETKENEINALTDKAAIIKYDINF